MHIFFAGLFLFLLGLEGSKKGLEGIASSRIEMIIKSLTANFYLSILVGIIVTGILQSSSAVTVILIGLIEAGLLELKPAIGVVLGANIGTTLTVQIISLPILSMYPYLILFGIFFMGMGIIFKKYFWSMGLAIGSFGIIFAGLEIMTGYFSNPAVYQLIADILATSGESPIIGILLGVITTGIVQSSSAVTGIIVSLARNHLITLPVAIAIALGSNVGTCVTVFLVSFNATKMSKTLAWGHFIFNLVGVLVLLPFLDLFTQLVILTSNNLPRQIANAHSLFNLFNVILFLPFINTFVSFLRGNLRWK